MIPLVPARASAALAVWLVALMLGLAGPLLLAPTPAGAVMPDEMLDDPEMEARARDIGEQLRCVVCQGESIDESNAPLARDMRILVRKRLSQGDSNQEVIDYLQDRYGDFVLMKPPFKPTTWVLWLGPPLLLVAGGIGVAMYYRGRRGESAAAPLSPSEEARLQALLEAEDAAANGRHDDAANGRHDESRGGRA
ncbi:cytochrome c-type biogenesis protein [Roseospirillum parvum]|uniref:Cytochrome c-type biogenesis protein n=1 Tax=Roseospirillum parvum TaxID=83401 RepID=A0A1G8C3Y3_9PROT|nr:cytochrome c-type biogenesis protein [Roseospirillum parvum]SDH40073.1 cytochrome c-type biogenesis protein CcmH [Roseospirillum parvum]